MLIACINRTTGRRALLLASALLTHSLFTLSGAAQTMAPPQLVEQPMGPYDVHVLSGGRGLSKPIPSSSRMLQASATYTLLFWFESSEDTPSKTLIAGLGEVTDEDSRFIGLVDGRPVLRMGENNSIAANTALRNGAWHLLAVTFDGAQLHLYADGAPVAQGNAILGRLAPQLSVAPSDLPKREGFQHFGGNVAGLTLLPETLSSDQIRTLAQKVPDVALLRFEEASKPWPVQVRGQAGYLAPQDPSLMPHSAAPYGKPSARPLPPASPSLSPATPNTWIIRSNWALTAAPEVSQDGAILSTAGFDTRRWMRATIPGTVLTTMVDRGIYPDPDFGLNNLAIPESLNKHDYWYRVEFDTPKAAVGRNAAVTFNGINYAADVWLNGHNLGQIKGAFLRGSFDVTPWLRSGQRNALAVRVSPPPHPGIPHEQSIEGGPGENGGAMCLDGPTFVATEGWDWIPAIRDRNTGIWQDVVLTVTDQLKIGDPQVVTHLPLPDTSSADVEIDVPVRNLTSAPVEATVHAAFEQVDVVKKVTISPGATVVHLSQTEFPQLHVDHPRLWWPNGYGRPDLYHLKLSVAGGAAESDTREITFGIREVTYELSLFDPRGHLSRVEIAPTVARNRGEQIVDVRHEGMLQTTEFAASSLTPVGEHSPAVKAIANESGLTDLVLKVNGVRIAARGGNWGMDDSRKRVSREHLEPFFRLHRDANLNIIRNWVGQDTEETFFQLADEYGLMVWNDFWTSTQDYNVEPQDVPLFLNNARDVVARFRNHPSIIIWCGRNEGVPQPILNQGLIDIFRELDGTRYYTPGSNRINLRNSGPYKYQDPVLFYTTLDKGFSVELGIQSLSTLESLRSSIAEPDLWPISDAWAYHDWHHGGNGDVAPFMRHVEEEFGAATDLKDFERKAQMFNYVDHRAIFEGFNQHLWTPNSGRMLWMTQPAWPSNMWQILSSDYDTQASFYGVKKACEPLHVQLDLSDFTVTAVNTTNSPSAGLSVSATVYSLANQVLLTQNQALDLKANAASPLFALQLAPLFAREGVVLIKLQMKDAAGKVLSNNFYWLAGEESAYRKLNTLAVANLSGSAHSHREGDELVVDMQLTNRGTTASLATKATLLHANSGARILPAYLSDNYISLLPGETVDVTIRCPASEARDSMKIALRGWNAPDISIAVAPRN